MKGKVELARRALRLLYETLFTVLLMQFLHVVILKYHMGYIQILAIAVLFIVSYVIRDMISSYGIIWVLHIIAGIILWILPFKTGTTVLFTLLAVHLMFTSFEYGMKGNKLKPMDDFPWPTFVFSFIVYIYGKGLESTVLENISYGIPVVLLMLYYIMVYMDGVREYVDSTKDVSGLPLKRIIGTNTILVGMILSITCLAIFIGRYIDFRAIVNAIGNGIVYIIKVFAVGLSFIFRFIIMIMSGDGEGAVESAQNISLPAQKELSGTGSLTDQLLFKLLFVVFLIYVFYIVVSKVIKRLKMSRVYEGDIVEKAETNKKNRDYKIKPRRVFAFKLSNEEKVRKYYRLRILREKYDIRLSSDKTCREIEEELKEKELGDVSDITDLYASVRYGDCVPDKKMVKQVNNLSKQ